VRKDELYTKIDSIRNPYSPICWHMFNLYTCERCTLTWYGLTHDVRLPESSKVILCYACYDEYDSNRHKYGDIREQKTKEIALSNLMANKPHEPNKISKYHNELEPEPYYAMLERVANGERPKSTLPKRLQKKGEDMTPYARVKEDIIAKHLENLQRIP